MTRRQRAAARGAARDNPPPWMQTVECGLCGTRCGAMSVRDALGTFEGDDFESWCLSDGLGQMQQRTGPDALVGLCQPCVTFTSICRDGTPYYFTISA